MLATNSSQQSLIFFREMFKQWNQIPIFLFLVVRTPTVTHWSDMADFLVIVWARKHRAQWFELVVVLEDCAADGEDFEGREVRSEKGKARE